MEFAALSSNVFLVTYQNANSYKNIHNLIVIQNL